MADDTHVYGCVKSRCGESVQRGVAGFAGGVCVACFENGLRIVFGACLVGALQGEGRRSRGWSAEGFVACGLRACGEVWRLAGAMNRLVEPEILDELAWDDPEAVRSRRDLRLVNGWRIGGGVGGQGTGGSGSGSCAATEAAEGRGGVDPRGCAGGAGRDDERFGEREGNGARICGGQSDSAPFRGRGVA